MLKLTRHLLYGPCVRLGTTALIAAAVAGLTGCGARGPAGAVERVIGSQGLMPGQFVKPRAIVIDRENRLGVVDFRAMIQWLTPDGEPISHWETPTHRNGRPSGLGLDREENLLVADSHYHRILVYDRAGKILRSFGGDEGEGPLIGRFGYIADVEMDRDGNIYIAESQQNERITKIDGAGNILAEWGGLGVRPGQFQRIRAMAFDSAGLLYVADACNHRIQVFTPDGKFVRAIGSMGDQPGEFSYPYDVAIAPNGDLYVCEYGNSRVQRLSLEGKPVALWGRPGRQVGELWNPWALAINAEGRVFVVDSNNHRIQRIRF